MQAKIIFKVQVLQTPLGNHFQLSEQVAHFYAVFW